jgi:hypothetical protein
MESAMLYVTVIGQATQKTSRYQRLNRLTSIIVDFVHPNDGDVNLIWRISAETTAKISWGLVSPY